MAGSQRWQPVSRAVARMGLALGFAKGRQRAGTARMLACSAWWPGGRVQRQGGRSWPPRACGGHGAARRA